MSPQRPRHFAVVHAVHQRLASLVGDQAMVRCQGPFAAADDSEPEPDVAVVPPGDYWDAHPSTAWLIVEVAHSSLRYDRTDKAPLYAQAGVPSYWIVNLVDDVVEVHSNPRAGRYTQQQTVDPAGVLELPHPFADLRLPVAALLGRGATG